MNRTPNMATRNRNYRRPANVLVMVISMLVMLFVFGTTFLLTARFDKINARQQAAASGAGALTGGSQVETVAQLINIDILRQLRDDVVGGTGLPYDGIDLKTDVIKDFGDAPGLDGLLSAHEPHFDGTITDWSWYRISTPHDNLELLKSGQFYPGSANDSTLTNIPINVAMDPTLMPPGGSWLGPHNMQFEWWNVLGATASVIVPDAEGDGMPSSMIWTRYDFENNPLVLDEETQALGTFGERYVVAARVIPNGAMVTAYRDRLETGLYAETPDSLVQVVRVLGEPDLSTLANTEKIDPLIEEPVLRNRFFLPRDFSDPQIQPTLLEALWPDTLLPSTLQLATPAGPRYRSWPIDYNFGNRVPNETWWERRLDPTLPEYDRRHLITTISYDDVYRRRATATAEQQKQIMQFGVAPLGTAVPMINVLRNYPNFPPTFNAPSTATDGKLMFSLRGLEDPEGFVLPGAGGPIKGQQLTYLYAHFRAMLEHVDTALMSDSERNERAAALAINTWDYFDADTEPTFSNDIYGVEGAYTYTGQTDVLGIEGQPFITEAMAKDIGDMDSPEQYDVYAVELFNPWPYQVTLLSGDWGLGSGGNAPGNSIPGADVVIPPATTPGLLNADQSNIVVVSNVGAPGVAPGYTGAVILDVGLSFSEGGSGSVVSLWRRVPSGGLWRKVDDIRMTLNGGEDTTWLPAATPSATEVVQRRLLKVGAGVARSDWKFCVGIEKKPVSGLPTLGDQNVVPVTEVAGVPLLFNNSGNPVSAFPTTGSLLLVNSVANEGTRTFSDILVEDLGSSNDPYTVTAQRVDNGHMPIFDQEDGQTNNDDNQRANVWEPWDNSAIDNKDLPWGQLVFDYFTVLPLEEVTVANQAKYAGLPLVEKVIDLRGNAIYGPRVKGRININAAPWRVMDGIPAIDNVGPLGGGQMPVQELDDLLTVPAALPNGWFEPNGGVWSITMEFAQLIQSYRENRDVLGQLQTPPMTSALWPVAGGLRPSTTNGVRPDDGLLSVGELANVVISAEGGWVPPDFLSGVVPLVRISDWVTVKSNVFTVYTTVVDREEDDGVIRSLTTIDRTNTLYTDDMPVVVTQTLLKK